MAAKRLQTLASLSIGFSRSGFDIPTKLWLRTLTRRYNVGPKPQVLNLDRLPNRSTPWLMLHPEIGKNNTLLDRFYSPEDNQIVQLKREEKLGISNFARCIASSRGWLGFVEPKGECRVYLTSPFGVGDIIRLPSLATMPGILGVERDTRTEEVVGFKKWDRCNRRRIKQIKPYVMLTPEELVEQEQISNLTLSSSDPRHESFVVVATQGADPTETRVDYCRVGKECEWKVGVHALDKHLRMDFIKHVTFSGVTNLFYAIQDGDMYSFNLHHDTETKTVKFIEKEDSEGNKRLTKAHFIEPYVVALENGDILYIMRHYKENYEEDDHSYQKRVSETSSFEVFRVDFNNSKVERVESIGDRAIFIGANDSFSLCTAPYNHLQPNSIYFVEHKRASPERKMYHNGEVRIYDMTDNELRTCFASTQEQDFADLSFNTNQLLWVSPPDFRN
ncbi:hypothetical protein RND81_10G197700 [Saponaria officinalis]|uniref:KIB1-4 beta-propeller domain-containing protein n=1 Tax=Saponaria officinalis TaxID=3572 RepID=A0AAW1I3U0_SAPOF